MCLRNYWFLNKISIFVGISIFDRNFNFWQKFQFLPEIVDFWQKFKLLQQFGNFGYPKLLFWPILQFLSVFYWFYWKFKCLCKLFYFFTKIAISVRFLFYIWPKFKFCPKFCFLIKNKLLAKHFKPAPYFRQMRPRPGRQFRRG